MGIDYQVKLLNNDSTKGKATLKGGRELILLKKEMIFILRIANWCEYPYVTRNDTDVSYSFSVPLMVSIIMCLTDDETRRLSNLLKVIKEKRDKAEILT